MPVSWTTKSFPRCELDRLQAATAFGCHDRDEEEEEDLSLFVTIGF